MSGDGIFRERRDSPCPWWTAYLFDNPFRRIVQNPKRILGNYAREGMTAVDVGCGMGIFAIGLAEAAGENGTVAAIDIQPEMFPVLMKRAARRKVRGILPVCADARKIGTALKADLITASYSVHEISGREAVAREVNRLLKPGGYFFLMEPLFHVGKNEFYDIVNVFTNAGLIPVKTPRVRMSRTVLFRKPENADE